MEAVFKLRLPRDLRDWIEYRAAKNCRSMNREIHSILAAIRRGEEDDPQGFQRLGETYTQDVAR